MYLGCLLYSHMSSTLLPLQCVLHPGTGDEECIGCGVRRVTGVDTVDSAAVCAVCSPAVT